MSGMRRPGRSRRTWLYHIQQDSGVTPSTAWDSEVASGHGAAQRSQTMQQLWWCLRRVSAFRNTLEQPPSTLARRRY